MHRGKAREMWPVEELKSAVKHARGTVTCGRYTLEGVAVMDGDYALGFLTPKEYNAVTRLKTEKGRQNRIQRIYRML